MKRFDESIHITNTSVQLKYKETTSFELPEHHMWSLQQLEGYLERLGHKNAYMDVIYPEMKRVLKAFTMASYSKEFFNWKLLRLHCFISKILLLLKISLNIVLADMNYSDAIG